VAAHGRKHAAGVRKQGADGRILAERREADGRINEERHKAGVRKQGQSGGIHAQRISTSVAMILANAGPNPGKTGRSTDVKPEKTGRTSMTTTGITGIPTGTDITRGGPLVRELL
jgi:hypothetical protein